MQYPQIVFLIDSLGMGGAERLMIPYLQEFVSTDFNPRVCAFQVRDGNPIAHDIEQLGVPVDLLPVRNLRNVDALPRLLRYLREHYADLLHTQLQFANILGSSAAKILDIPTVCTLHTIGNLDKKVRGYWRDQAMQWVLKAASDRVIAVSEQTRRYYIEQAGFAADKTITLHNGIYLDPFTACTKESTRALRQELGIAQDAPVLITVAVLRPPKGIQYMLEALPAIVQAVPDVVYVVVGSGEHEAKLQELVQQKQIAENVLFTGARSDIPSLLAMSDIFVLPTLTEALPTVLAEAMAAQKPIIASQVGGVPEMVEHERNGLLLEPAQPAQLVDACVRLLRNPSEAERMGKTGLEIAHQRFDIRKQAQRLGDVYLQLLEERRKRKRR
jgi:glycosyltransferase involved in cell wall biosynthesis